MDPTCTVPIEYVDPRFFDVVPVVSVVMLVYNHAAHLAQAIESILRQETEAPVELLIGEDCSTDDSREIALGFQRRYPDKIRIITANRNVGGYRNCMRTFDAVRGEFIAYIDGDDYWLPGKISLQLAMLRARPDAVAVYSNTLAVDRDGCVIGQFNDVGDREFSLSLLLRRGNVLCMSTMMFRAERMPEVRGIGQVFIDYEMHLTHARHGCILHAGRCLAAYRVGSAGSLVATNNALVRSLYWQAIQGVPRSLVSDADYAHALADFLRRVCFRAVRTKDLSLLREWVLRVFSASPYGWFRTGALVVGNVIRSSAKHLALRVMKLVFPVRPAILYPR